MKKPFVDSSEQLKERLRRIVKKPRFLRTAEITLLVALVLIAGLLLAVALQDAGDISRLWRKPEQVKITNAPVRSLFIVGEKLDTTGLELTLTYADGTTETVSKGFTCSPQVLDTIGKHIVTVTCGGKTTTYQVTVVKATGSGSCGKDLLWNITSGGELIITGSGSMQDFKEYGTPWESRKEKIKAVYLPEGLVSISNYAFADCGKMTKIYIPETVTAIGRNAFADCTSLCSVQIPSGVRDLEQQTFFNCTKLEMVQLPAQLRYIGKGAFMNCSKLQSIALPDSLATISIGAFQGSGLQQITIPGSVTEIGASAFGGCTALEGITISNGVISIGNNAFNGCRFVESLFIPASVQSIGESAFYISYLKRFSVDPQNAYFCTDAYGVLYTKGFEELVQYPQDRSGSYTVAQGCTAIRKGAFLNCVNLTGITLPDTLQQIESFAFTGCSQLPRVIIPASVISLGDCCFSSCRLLWGLYIFNPDCTFAWDLLDMPSKTMIFGYEGSTAQQYAQQQGYQFIALQE